MKYLLVALFLFAAQPASAQLMMPVTNNSGIEEQVRVLFADAPVMVDVARCESGFRQYTNTGSVVRGGTGGNYIGVFQLSSGHHVAAQSLGMDIYTTEGNLAYARHMYDRQSTKPWISCVPKSAAIIPTARVSTIPSAPSSKSTFSILNSNLQLGMSHPQVATLQQLLNAAGFTISATGPGSPGNETTTFGALTREAVKKFQCAKNITCSGSESTTGFGRLGPRTRTVLLETVK